MRYQQTNALSLVRRRLMLGMLLVVLATVAGVIYFVSSDGAHRAFATPVCENGTIIPNHADHPQLVEDCTVLLDLQPTLAGTATLNWGANTALTSWNGITVGSLDGIQRVTELDMDGQGLNGTIPAQLGQLSALRELRLAWGNQLTSSIPAELGRLTRLTFLNLAANHLSGPIPPELGSIGPQLTHLVLSAPQPLPNGVGLTGSIPAQLGNLSGLTSLYLDGNRLTGSIPPRLGRMLNLSWVHLKRNQLTGAIPTQLGALTNLTNLLLEDNQLSGPIPSQLSRLTNLRKVYLKRNAGFTGCVPPRLREVRFNDIATLNLSNCASDAPETPETPLPTYTLTVTAGEGGAVDPAGVSTHTEAVPVILTASWNDATHTFAGWDGACTGSATNCTLEMYADTTVSAAFAPLSADRCASPTAADCIRAVYQGAPDDYAQVQDIPADLLIQPDSDGRYQVERGQQYTVVTAARLPSGWSRFYLQRTPDQDPVNPTSFMQLIPPVGTTFTFTVNTDERGSNLLNFDLHAARPLPIQRPGIKPELGDIIVTTEFYYPTLRYHKIDASGAASTNGSYAFLRTSGDNASATNNVYQNSLELTELKLNIFDTSGTARSDFYDIIEPGNTFDFRTNGLDCSYRYKVTTTNLTSTHARYGLVYVTEFGGDCIGPLESEHDVQMVWFPSPGLLAADGIPVLLYNEPVSAGTYRLASNLPYIITVPEGSQLVLRGLVRNARDEGDDDVPLHGIVLIDPDTGSSIQIDPLTGNDYYRVIKAPEATRLFDRIMASINYQE